MLKHIFVSDDHTINKAGDSTYLWNTKLVRDRTEMKTLFPFLLLLQLRSCISQHDVPNGVQDIYSVLQNFTSQDIMTYSKLINMYAKFTEAKKSFEKLLLQPDSICSKQILSVVEGIDKNEAWAFQMLDSSAKLPAGILFGNYLSLGNYEECTEIQHYDENIKTQIKGQYCSAVATLGQTNVDLNMLAESDNLVEAVNQFDFSNVVMMFGICVPSGCTTRDLQSISDSVFSEVSMKLTFIKKLCSVQDEEVNIPTRSVIGIIIFSTFGLLLVLGTIVDIVNTSAQNTILKCFSVYSNGKKLFSSRTGEDSLLCLNGLRVLSMMLIILGHRFIMTNGLPSVNRIEVERWKDRLDSYIFIGLGFAVDTFFTISGLLVTYLSMRTYEKGNTIHWGMFYVHRFLRLSPSLIMIVIFYATMINFIQHQPFAIVDEYVGQACREYWWTTILYIQNYWNPTNMCAVHTWYLAIDTQLYILSPVMIIGLLKFPKKTLAALVFMILLSISAAFEVTWQKKLGATYLNQNPEEYGSLYTPTHIRVPPWLLGAIMGYLIAKYKGKIVKLNKILVLCLWIFSLGSLLLILLIQKAYHNTEYNVWYSSAYNSLARPLWGIAICIIIGLCVFGKGGIVNSFLSCSLFNILIRINYAVYLVHMLVSVSILAKIRTTIFLSVFNIVHEALGDYLIVLPIAILWTLSFESPIIAMEKIIFTGGGRKEKLPLNKNTSNNSNGSCETVIVK